MTQHTRTFTILKPATMGGAALAAILALASCSSSAPASEQRAGDTLAVVATTTQLTDFAAQVGGDDIELTGLLQPGASAHHFDPTPADLAALGEADVLIVNGAGLDDFVEDAVEASGFDGELVTAADGLQLDEEEEGHDHAEDEEEHAGEDEHAHEDEHDHGGVNPHIWTSPHNAEHMVEQIAKGFAEADPAQADDFEQRAADYIEQLEALDTWVHEQFEQVPAADRVMVSGHDSLHYYLEDYGIEFVGSILPSFDDNAEPSAADIDELVHEIKEHGVKAIFVESSMSPKLAQTIAREAGVQVVDAETLYADSLAEPGEEGDTYIGATIHNTRVILEAWGAEPEPLPAILQE